MKKLYSFIVLAAVVFATAADAAQLVGRAAGDVRGRVIDKSGVAVGYATVVAMSEGSQAAGTTSDDNGRFVMKLPRGEYKVVIDFVGYESAERAVSVGDGEVDMGDIVLKEASTEIGEVVVSAQMIRREADRFVVDVANSAGAIGKDGTELLRQSPGVWVDDDKIAVNGASGTKVYINDREVRLSGEELVQYVRNLRAEDIAKIEVIPQTGADHDADSSGGAIKITLKRRLDNGMMGSVRMYTQHNGMGSSYDPSASINYHAGRFDLSASGWYSNSSQKAVAEENTVYNATDAVMNALSTDRRDESDGGASIAAVAEINPRHSVGASFDYWRWNDGNVTDSHTSYEAAGADRLSKSLYDHFDKRENFSATFNYIMKIDTLGSTFKLIGDYTQRDTEAGTDNSSRITESGATADSLYFDRTNSLFRVATASVALDKRLSQHWTLRTGAKYTYNEINADARYRWLDDGAWVPSVADDYDIAYTENIGALYAVASMNYGRWSVVAGLRGEYTFTEGKGADIDRDYFSLFPNANVSFRLDKEGRHSLVAQYSRTISRPGFWSLTPNRMQVSDYTYQTGNPLLDPSYVNTCSLTAVMAYKYSVTLSASLQNDAIQQLVVVDEDDPRMLNLTWENLPKQYFYTLSVNLPFTVTKWWDWNVSLNGMAYRQQLTSSSPVTNHTVAQWSTQMSFKLPLSFFADVDYNGMTNMVMSNAKIKGLHRMGVTLKKKFGDSWTVTCALRNIIPLNQDLSFEQPDFVRRVYVKQFYSDMSVRVGVSWNFKSGKAFRQKSVESGSADEASRL